MKHVTSGFFALLLLVVLGCGNPSVIGTVKFDDGTPLAQGVVQFNGSQTQATGMIQPNGTFAMFEKKPGDGVTPGNYKVTVIASTGGGSDGEPLVQLVDPKFAESSTSGLTCEVKGTTTFDITVTKPAAGK